MKIKGYGFGMFYISFVFIGLVFAVILCIIKGW